MDRLTGHQADLGAVGAASVVAVAVGDVVLRVRVARIRKLQVRRPVRCTDSPVSAYCNVKPKPAQCDHANLSHSSPHLSIRTRSQTRETDRDQ